MCRSRFERRAASVGSATVFLSWLFSATFALPARADDFRVPPYHYGVWYTIRSVKPSFEKQRPQADISTADLRDRLFDRLESLGINMASYAYAIYRGQTVYAHDNPGLKPQDDSWSGRTPVKDFLDDCYGHNMAAFLGISIRPGDQGETDFQQYVERAADDLTVRFQGHPALAGINPPAESVWSRISGEQYANIAGEVKRLNPRLQIMDFPSGPHLPQALRAIMDHAYSGVVDIENVQFYTGNSSVYSYYFSLYREMAGFRGLTLLVDGLCPNGVQSLIHTHYMQGGAKHNIPWEHRYRVSQSAPLTATRHGARGPAPRRGLSQDPSRVLIRSRSRPVTQGT